MTGPVRIRLFGPARQAVGRGELAWPSDGPPETAQALVARLGATYPALRPILRHSRFLRNGRLLDDLNTRVRAGDEFAVHPPYGGG